MRPRDPAARRAFETGRANPRAIQSSIASTPATNTASADSASKQRFTRIFREPRQRIIRPYPADIRWTPLLDDNGRTTCGYHQHAVALAKHLVVEVDTNNGICSHQTGTLLQFSERNFSGLLQFFFVRG